MYNHNTHELKWWCCVGALEHQANVRIRFSLVYEVYNSSLCPWHFMLALSDGQSLEYLLELDTLFKVHDSSKTASSFSKWYPTVELHTSPFLTFGKEAGGLAKKPACTLFTVFSLVLLWILTACLSIQGQSLVRWSSSSLKYRREWGAKNKKLKWDFDFKEKRVSHLAHYCTAIFGSLMSEDLFQKKKIKN